MLQMYKDLEKVKSITNYLNKATKAYDEGKPIISDKTWDSLYDDLVKLEEETGYVMVDSPTQSIQYEVVNELEKVEHNHPMLSLDKTKDMSQFINYFTPGKDVIGMLKLDGLTCSLRYIDGELASAETRGNGTVGENILHNARVISSIPKYINYKEELILDGEIICTYEDFKPFSEEYANPRNFASGSIRLLDSKECSKRNLTFVVWNIIKGFDEENSFLTRLQETEKLGFCVVPFTSSLDWDWDEFLQNQAKKLGYPIDGLVGRYDDIKYGESLGATGHHARAAYAFKFYDEEHETILKDIEWTMGRTGVLTPVAVFEPVDDGESVIERASLHNISIMRELLGDLPYKGQPIKIFKANQIIPQISWAGPDASMFNYDVGYLLKKPDFCPICGSSARVIESDSGVLNLICENLQCQGKLINRLDHFCGKKGLDIKGLSKATLEKLIDWGWVNNLKDLFFLYTHEKDWREKPGFGLKSVGKILEAIENSKNCELSSFISALGIPLIGSTYAKTIAKNEYSWVTFREDIQGKYDFTKWDGFGLEILAAIRKFNYTEADELALDILNIKNSSFKDLSQQVEDSEKSLDNMTICITGKLIQFKNRAALATAIEEAGGKVTGSVSKNTNYLINNDNTSTSAKNLKAKSLNIPILTEVEFVEKFL